MQLASASHRDARYSGLFAKDLHPQEEDAQSAKDESQHQRQPIMPVERLCYPPSKSNAASDGQKKYSPALTRTTSLTKAIGIASGRLE